MVAIVTARRDHGVGSAVDIRPPSGDKWPVSTMESGMFSRGNIAIGTKHVKRKIRPPVRIK